MKYIYEQYIKNLNENLMYTIPAMVGINMLNHAMSHRRNSKTRKIENLRIKLESARYNYDKHRNELRDLEFKYKNDLKKCGVNINCRNRLKQEYKNNREITLEQIHKYREIMNNLHENILDSQ